MLWYKVQSRSRSLVLPSPDGPRPPPAAFAEGGTSSAGPFFPFPGPAAALSGNMIHLFLAKRKVFWAASPDFRQKIFAFPSDKKVRHSPKIRAVSKKGLAYFLNMRYNRNTRQIEAGRKVVTHLTPLCRRRNLLHNSFAAPALIILETPSFIKGGFKGVVSVSCGVG